MSLRMVHVLLMTLATALASLIAVWLTMGYRAGGGITYGVGVMACAVAICALATYTAMFVSRSRQW